MRRSRRRFVERLFVAYAYRCQACKSRFCASRLQLLLDSRYSSCPQCRSYEVRVIPRSNRTMRTYRHPLQFLQKVLHAPLRYCRYCKLQFFDFRPCSKQPMKTGLQTAADPDLP